MYYLRFISAGRMLGFLMMIFLISFSFSWPALAEDIIVNGTVVTKPGGQYDQIVVINNGTLTIEDDIVCNSLILEYGTIYINGNYACLDSMSLLTNPVVNMTVYGDSNTVYKATIRDGANLHLLGLWNFHDLSIVGGKISTIPRDASHDSSGYAVLDCYSLYVSPTGHISADAAGNDPRGKGGGWYRNSGGGGYGGTGGRGYWNATHRGPSFGNFYTYEIFMGGQGGSALGGGSLHIRAEIADIAGKVSSNGQPGGRGGGSGGGIMLTVNQASLTGVFEANGGPGENGNYGGGAGGRIKLFYYSKLNDDDPNFATFTVNGAWGFQYGENGTIYFNSIPEIPELVLPEDSTVIENLNPTFSFIVADSSVIYDGRDESLLCKIELSLDEFATVYRTYDQSVSTSGWSNYSFKNGDLAEYTSSDLLGISDTTRLKWRVTVQDRSLFGKYSDTRYLTLIDSTGVTSITEQDELLPLAFNLKQNYPNPFNPQTTIGFTIPPNYNNQQTKLSIYNILSQKVITLFKGNLPAGYHQRVWNGYDQSGHQVATGTYIYILQLDDRFTQTKKMVLIK